MSESSFVHSAQPLATALLTEQRKRWLQGERILVEDYLRDRPTLSAEPEIILDLLYHEILLREQQGETPHLEEYVRRFPEFPTELELHFEVHKALPAVSATVPGHGRSPAAPTAPPVWPAVPGYEILAEIGRGGMGVVYKARHRGLNRLVALKMIGSSGSGDPERLARFRSEAEAVARLQSPHIVQIHDIGEVAGQPYFALELIDGGSLSEHLSGVPTSQRQAAALVETVARAIHHVHERGIVHRDLKPANILLQRKEPNSKIQEPNIRNPSRVGSWNLVLGSLISDFEPKITDFGLAKFLEDRLSAAQTQSGDILGTPSYMAPEQASGVSRNIGPATDIYALGAVLYEMLTGRPPFRGITSLDTLQQVRFEAPVPPRRLQPRIALDLETICLKCLEKEADKRYPTAQALADDLARFLAGQPIHARPVSSAEKLWRWCRRKPAVAGLLAVLALVFLAGSSGVLWQWQRASRNSNRAEQNAAAYRRERDIARQEKERAERHLQIVRGRVKELDRLGHKLLRTPGKYRAGQAVLQQALAFYQELLPDEGKDPEVRREAADLFGQVAWIHHTFGQEDKAAETWDHQARLLTSLLKEEPADAALRMGLADCHRWRGNALRYHGKASEALKAYNQAADLHEELLREFPDEAHYHVALANTLLNMAPLLSGQNSADDQQRLYQRILNLYRAAVGAAPDNPQFKAELALGLEDQGQFFLNTGRTSEAEAPVREAVQIHQRMRADGQMKGAIERSEARSLVRLGRVFAAASRLQEAEESYRQAVNLLDRPFDESPESASRRADLAQTLIGLANLLQEPGRRGEVAEILRRAINHYEKLQADFQDNTQYRINLVLNYLRLIRLLGDLGKSTEAAEPYRKALELESEDAAVNNELAWFLATSSEPRWRDAARAVRLANKAVSAQSESGNYRNTLGVANYRSGDNNAAVAELEKAMNLRAGGDSLDWFFLAMAHWRLGDRDKARTWFDRAVQWMDKHKPQDEELRRFRAEAEAMLSEAGNKKNASSNRNNGGSRQ